MAEPQNPKTPPNPVDCSAPQPPSKISVEANNGSSSSSNSNGSVCSGHKFKYPNPPDAVNPDPTTLRDQWRFAIRQYSRWYSHAWGTAILAGAAFFALGWIIKGTNPLPSWHDSNKDQNKTSGSSASDQPHGAR